MKKLYYLITVGLLAASLAGCNQGWQGCFSRGSSCGAPQAYENCCEPCDQCQTYYGDASAEWVPVSPGTVNSYPTPGPAKSTGTPSDS